MEGAEGEAGQDGKRFPDVVRAAAAARGALAAHQVLLVSEHPDCRRRRRHADGEADEKGEQGERKEGRGGGHEGKGLDKYPSENGGAAGGCAHQAAAEEGQEQLEEQG